MISAEELVERTADQMALVRPVLGQIADKWTIMILAVVCLQPARFNEIRRRLGGITHKALADALKRLEKNGLVTRTVLPTQPVGVEYAITPLGLSIQEPIDTLIDWALEQRASFDQARADYDARRETE